jgi:hypothetical protein
MDQQLKTKKKPQFIVIGLETWFIGNSPLNYGEAMKELDIHRKKFPSMEWQIIEVSHVRKDFECAGCGKAVKYPKSDGEAKYCEECFELTKK